MKCHVLIPNLFWPDPAFRIEPLPNLETLLAKGEHTRSEGQGLEEWLCRAFRVRPQQDWPVAPLTLREGAEDLDYWLRADPVHLQVKRDHLVLLGPDGLSISPEEADSLVRTLNRHFEPDGFFFARESPDVWLLRISDAPRLVTTPLMEVLGRDIESFLPKGVDAMKWNRITNEVQMILHDHPVNEAREERGSFPVNSVWFWGGGIAPDVKRSPFASIASENLLARGLASQSGTPLHPVPGNAQEWLASLKGEGEHLVVLEELMLPSRYGDAAEWEEKLRSLETQWFAPLHRAVQNGLELTLSDNERGMHFQADRLDLWKFWKKNRPILEYLK